jgi:hypothetical protein
MRLLARDHAAPEPTLILAKAIKPWRGRVRPLAWCSRPRNSVGRTIRQKRPPLPFRGPRARIGPPEVAIDHQNVGMGSVLSPDIQPDGYKTPFTPAAQNPRIRLLHRPRGSRSESGLEAVRLASTAVTLPAACLSGGRWRRVARPGGGGRPARVRGGVALRCAAGEPPAARWQVG